MENLGQLQDFLNVLRQRRWQIVLPALFVLTLGIALAVVVPKKYLVVTRIELRESPLGEESAPEREKFATEFHVKHYQRVRGVIEGQAELWPEYFELPANKRGDFVAEVIGDIDVVPHEKAKDRGSSFIDIAYTDVDPERAERFLSELTGLWISEVVERDLNAVRDELRILRDEKAKATNEWSKKKADYNELSKQLGLDPTQPVDARFENRGDSLLRRLRQAEEDLAQVEVELDGMRAELEELQEQLLAEPPTIVTESDNSAAFEQAILRIQAGIADRENELARYKPANSRYRRIQDELNTLRRELADSQVLRDQASSISSKTPNPEYRRLEEAISQLQVLMRSKRGVQDSLVREIADLEVQSLPRYGDYNVLRRLDSEAALAWTEVQSKAQAAEQKAVELRVMEEAYGRPFDIVQEPEASEEPTEPNPALIVGVTLFLGLGLGLALAILGEFARNGFRSVHDLRHVMNVPVLGAINAIVTRAEGRRLRARRTVVGLSSAIVMGTVLYVVLQWQQSPESLPIPVLDAIEGLREMML